MYILVTISLLTFLNPKLFTKIDRSITLPQDPLKLLVLFCKNVMAYCCMNLYECLENVFCISGYNQQMMPPPNSMGYMPGSGKMGGQMPGHYPQYNSQYPQGNSFFITIMTHSSWLVQGVIYIIEACETQTHLLTNCMYHIREYA